MVTLSFYMHNLKQQHCGNMFQDWKVKIFSFISFPLLSIHWVEGHFSTFGQVPYNENTDSFFTIYHLKYGLYMYYSLQKEHASDVIFISINVSKGAQSKIVEDETSDFFFLSFLHSNPTK